MYGIAHEARTHRSQEVAKGDTMAPGNLGGSAMALLRFIATDGREQDVADIDGLHDLILDGRIGYESLVRDDASGRWVKADDHPLFKRIREIAGQQQPLAPPIPAAPPSRARIVVQAGPVTAPAAGPKTKPKSKWFAAIATREEALKTINETALGFFALAGIQTVMSLFLIANSSNVGLDSLIDVPLYVGLAAWLKWGRSRTAAVLLLIVASIAVVTTVLGQLRIIGGGRNMILAAIVFWTAVKAVEATFKLRGRFKDGENAAPSVAPVEPWRRTTTG
jgi:hypothetical protein